MQVSNQQDELKNALENLPNHSGVYQYFDIHDNLLYIGKAKNLKKRVKSYFDLSQNSITPRANLSQRIALMISQTAKIHTLLTDNEQDALILENSLIKSLKPRYNILLRDDKTYPYLYINTSQPFPRFELTRQIFKSTKQKQILYFGPFVSGARDLLESLYEILPLVQKKSCLRDKKACIFHQIDKCKAPCEGKISTQEYAQSIAQGIHYIENKKSLIKVLESKMQLLSEKLQFEEAARIRDKIQKISTMKNQSVIDLIHGDFDILNIEQSTTQSVLMKLFVRNGRIISSDFSLLPHIIESDNLPQVYTQALLNQYKTPMPLLPQEILIPYFEFNDIENLQIFLRTTTQSSIKITQPQRGKKKNLLDLCAKNAQEILRSQGTQNIELFTSLKNLLGLVNTPYTIEVFDTSHHSGTHNVGGMVVYENNEFISSKFRRYELSVSDEYSQMNEMLTRRAQSFETNPPPDLWLIDGGKAQVNLAQEILKSVGANVDVIGIAKMKHNSKIYRTKGKAYDTLYTKGKELKLSPSDRRLQFLQKLRDEVHRYAISYHRYKKRKNIEKVTILGHTHYSSAQVKRLLDYFGSFEQIQQASEEQIKKILKTKTEHQTKSQVKQCKLME